MNPDTRKKCESCEKLRYVLSDFFLSVDPLTGILHVVAPETTEHIQGIVDAYYQETTNA
jgi:hypothetical protein